MRLTSHEIKAIKTITNKIFGGQATVSLFGSRVDDMKKGGDIDLLIKCPDKNKYTIENKVRFLAELKQEIGDQKIDVVFDNQITRQKKFFYNSITRNKILLK
ncbi:nucleotidyltransferase domain-containing protein [Anaerophaga thermohalophila]|jgi:predicted nucleotidyltransferase|uniref:nucleotidyltransferase domain-containing protein n=1 Tax=Anaerophaga thermohalophila TaxID=177400 RepID=UPI00031E06ED|nr:nucleotidyltransferase domain-containing protein [Anaerophaga thermohalophila]